ncbi:hypothetical protein BGZ96_001969 [Linnemannia gamsii]|uniref:Uncharacterized protein n=1 Tax=Linnemannia gamsii TaxID=64522 RepID=A0ABQ7JLN6_9FUNG|nr:hypothetical protein BGZ96_001969 [Linnemannia gamsii]
MLPTKRSSPFVRTRSFQDRNSKDRTDADGAPLAKRPFTRTMSSPFQVVTTSLKGTKNPFEKLAVAPSPKPASNSLSTDYAALHINEDQADDLQDESMDPNKTLRMFSLPKNPSATTSTTTKESSSESDDDEAEDNVDQSQDDQADNTIDASLNHETNTPGLRRPRLQEALEILTWCDQILPMDEIDALQHFISSQKAFCNLQRTSWTVLFQHGSVSLSGGPEALLTNSTPGLWKALEDEDINYEQLPNLGGKVAVNNFSSKHDLDHLEDLDEDETAISSSSNSTGSTPFQLPQKKDLSSTLSFRGQVDVHGLFSYLLNMKTSYEDGFLYQSPSLIAGVPFLHAALKRAQISKCKVVSRPVQGTDKMQKEYRVEIHGIVLPNSVKDLYQTFAAQQRPFGYTCISTCDARYHGLNLRPLLPETTDTENSARLTDVLVSAKSLDHFQHDSKQQQYVWLS